MAAAASSSAATEHTEDLQLIELVDQEAGMSLETDLKVIRNEIVDYTYSWQGKQVPTQKVQVVLQSKVAEQYCLGVAKLQKKNEKGHSRRLQVVSRLARHGRSETLRF